MAEVLGIIPAKRESTRLPGKNLKLLGGRPLLSWTIEAALAAKSLTRVVVSTEDPEIKQVALDAGAEVLDRPPDLAEPWAQTHDVAVDVLDTLFPEEPEELVTVVLLPPTSPFRTARHIDEAVALYHDQDGYENVVSIGPRLPQHLVHWVPEVGDSMWSQKSLYHLVNVAIWITDDIELSRDKKFRTDGVIPYEMDRMSSLDIDYPEDFAVAEWWVKEQGLA